MLASSPISLVPNRPRAPMASRAERARLFMERLGQEAKIRLSVAQRAYALELKWQQSRREPSAPAQMGVAAQLCAVAFDLESQQWIGIQEGVNVRDQDVLRLTEGTLQITGKSGSQSAVSNDLIRLDGKIFLLKVFPPQRATLRHEVKRGVS